MLLWPSSSWTALRFPVFRYRWVAFVLGKVCVPYKPGSKPAKITQVSTILAYGLAVMSTMTNALNELGGHTAELESLNKQYIRHAKRIDI